ncbi:flagellar motor protein MotB [Isoptericola sp. b441]|uniref:Flagellar motor protein MotB n=1 Tax=Actinotalea lenta TaxID=3064654 RepID=A0ABT9D5N4_9CELL|nr:MULTISPECIES: flagellar motor protein MotB [unclassified Isoptericola]MDO8106112.1 flagellar motor protein MotB [Isoptericola sp. b441]MDO8122169.1 flagellar motor protein MotB [Isoptericola sp. b490]
MSSGHGHGSHGRSRTKREEHEEHENHERWAVSYADMMTVLVGLFIVLFAMSKVDVIKFEQLKQSLAIGFGHKAPSMMAGGSGVLSGLDTYQISPDFTSSVVDAQATQPPTPTTDLTQEQKNYDLAVTEYGRLSTIADAIAARLAKEGLSDRVSYQVTARGLVVGLKADDVFFSEGSATLTATAQAVLDSMAPVLRGIGDELSVEGHTNSNPTDGRLYATNWELSADRAVKVLRRLVETGGVPGARISATGFSDQRPVSHDHGDPNSANRRVDLVILTSVSDEIRKYLPEIAAKKG